MPEATATLLKRYAEFMDSTQEYVIVQALDDWRFAGTRNFRRGSPRHYPEARATEGDPAVRPADPPRPTPAIAAPRAASPGLA